MSVEETRARCKHEPSRDPRASDETCGKCGLYPIPSWFLTVAEARMFYEAIGIPDMAPMGIARLTGRPASEYSWTEYLTRDNAAGGIEEGVDAVHYGFFDLLVLRLLEATGETSSEEADAIRAELVAGAKAFAQGIRHYQEVRRRLKR